MRPPALALAESPEKAVRREHRAEANDRSSNIENDGHGGPVQQQVTDAVHVAAGAHPRLTASQGSNATLKLPLS